MYTYSKLLLLLAMISIWLCSQQEEEPVIERNPFSGQPPTQEERVQALMEGVKKFDQYRGFGTEKDGEDNIYNMDELKNYFKAQKPFMPIQFFEHFYYKMKAEVKEHDGLLNLRYFPALAEKFTEEFWSSLPDKEVIEIQTQRRDPYLRLSEAMELELDISDPDYYYGAYTRKLLEDESDKEYLDQVKYFDSYVGHDQTKRGKDGFINEYEMLNYVNFVTQSNPDKNYAAMFKASYYKDEVYAQQFKLSYKQMLDCFDDFQFNYFETFPEKWKEIQDNLAKESEKQEKEVMEFKQKELLRIEQENREKQAKIEQDVEGPESDVVNKDVVDL